MVKTPERRQVFLSLALNIFHTFFSVSAVDFEQVNITYIKYSY